MRRIIDIDVSAWTRIRSLNFLITWSIITAIKCRVNGLFSHYFVLDVILLLLMIVLTRARNFRESLSSVRCLALVLPEFSSLGFSEERLRFLANELTIWGLFLVFLRCIFNWYCSLVCTWSRERSFNRLVFAVGYLWLKDFVFTRWIELFLTLSHKVVDTRTWIIGPWLIVMSVVRLFK